MENENTIAPDQSQNATVNAVTPAADVVASPVIDASANNTIKLGYALMRGEQEIKNIELRKPVTGDLRGLSVTQLLNTDVDQMCKFLPRITTPALMPSEIEKLPVGDFLSLAMKSLGFFTESQSQTA
ncbi:bacteriophage putative tail protein Gp41 (plasmid) [Zymomonas mobilis subsp. mobilis ZM4 = ATCC 31821]|uniref:Tail E family protein n=1 Tax=Zymomonas mobilis subsp. mobilis (strain ATCC 31821 / ZM4 / CP4) TaxID=264203 RepID=A0A806CJP6_ZYMMO|nr:phage tail assembly protein [Zymomonas mobilis]ADC33792.1 tail E family protein [Zymomonas mobilis subsp. mobilis ZM4 = ATCC 31821]AHB11061.1 Mu-like prophage FluMu protein gp41 [Zymomonas mobilis subsp. mobilis str. CP4 = NRRL B-14023]AHJ71428.1 Phage tail protein E [Zymomonas mobilis subsp. mobilis NRRL B-12526]AHJ73268.1 Phage tail protein E [Zymomonas mobilis subsp. mobilis str. CP4 = NRRL B-14023]AVZ26870.1 bacteriophage putative tail protein Gp41 [Zymomonas mobilis subsp. mobilis]